MMKEAISLANFERAERGLPPIREPKVVRPEPVEPIVSDRIRFEDIPDLEIKDFSARGRAVKNEDGMRFTGFVFYLEFTGGKKVQGWLPEGEFQKLKARIPKERTDLLNKIATI
jgi:hypothetical protein